MLAQTRLKHRWAAKEHDDVLASPLTVFLSARSSAIPGTWASIVWSAHDLEESLRHALDSARRQHFEALVATWKRETVFVSAVTEKWSHPAYRSIIAMGRPAIPLILEQIDNGERLWTQALLSITAENPAEATRNPDEARQAWLKWGEENGWLDP